MKAKLRVFIVLLIAILAMSFSLKSEAAVKIVKIKTFTTYKIQKGEKLKLYVKGYKSNKKSKKVKWKSSNKKIATVSKKGVVTGKKGGTCKITATVKKKKYKAKIFVYAGENIKYEHDTDPKESTDRYNTDIVTLNESEKDLFIGQTFTLKVTGTNKKITWKSSNTGVATVSSNGKVSAISEGKTTITATYKDSKYVYALECDITVNSEWMSEAELEEKGLFFAKMSDSIIHITGQSEKDSLTGNCKSYSLELPENIQTNVIYGDKLKFKWNGSEFLYNTIDMKSLGLIVNS